MQGEQKKGYLWILERISQFMPRQEGSSAAQVEACEKLRKYATDGDDLKAVEKEINELRMALDLMT
jgi:hypothetical protein